MVDGLHCDRCGLCVPACPRQAIILEAEGEIEPALKVGSIVVATGFAPFTPAGSRYEAWAAQPQVITTVDLERLLSPQGPTGGRVLANGATAEPQDIAFVLCVGSREAEGNRYCSRVCCPTALKQALELKALSAPGPHPHLLPGPQDGQAGVGGPLHPGPGGGHRVHAGEGKGYPARLRGARW